MTDDIGTIIEDQFTRLLSQHVTRTCLEKAEEAPLRTELWDAVAEAGLPLALVSEDAGGIELSPVAAFRLVALAGQHALPAPLGETIAVAGLLQRVFEGPVSLAEATDGVAAAVPWGADAAHVLCAQDGEWRLVPREALNAVRSANLAGEARDALDVPVGAGERIAPPDWLAAGDLKSVGALVRTAQICGAMRRVVDMAIAHASERQQFGRPIAKFQAVQHMLADAAGQLAAATTLLDNAAEGWGRSDFAFRSALAKARAGSAAGKVAEAAHQVHAAMGFTREHDLNFYTRRLWSWRDEFGAERHWQGVIGSRVCAEGGDALWSGLVDATSGVAA